MKDKDIICDYCKKSPPEQTDCMPTWFGRYVTANGKDNLVEVICVDCIKVNIDKWRKGIFKA